MGRSEEGRMNGVKQWTTRELELLETHYPEHGPSWERWAELLPGRTTKAIALKAHVMGIRCRYRGPRSWTKAEDRMAVAMLAEVCRSTRRSPLAVLSHLAWLVRRAKGGG